MALDDATSRHNELMKLEQSITELNDIFKDMYELVHFQVTLLDFITFFRMKQSIALLHTSNPQRNLRMPHKFKLNKQLVTKKRLNAKNASLL